MVEFRGSWNSERKKKARKNILKNPNSETIKVLEEFNKKAKKQLKDIKIKSFREYTKQQLSRESDMSEVWKQFTSFAKLQEIFTQK